MVPPSVSGLGAALTGTWLAETVDQVTSAGPDFKGIAAIIAASAGMVTAISALVLGLRSKSNSSNDAEKRAEVLEKLLIEQLQKKDDDDPAD